jgi:hypothetical protein
VLETGQDAFVYTSPTSGEKNRYFLLLNSPQTPSASGLKAGGILCADSYDYAYPSKNNLVVKGSLGVGYPNPSPYTLAVNGSTYSLSGYSSSDARWKTNVQTFEKALETILNLRGVRFDWKPTEGMNFPAGRQIGFIAQEVEQVLPELVSADRNGYKSVAYANVIPVLVEAMKQQQKQLDAVKAENAGLKARLEQMEALQSQLSVLSARLAQVEAQQVRH